MLCRDAEDARDLVADTAERALRFSSHFAAGSNLRAWLGQILFSVFVTRCRRQARQRRAHDWLRDDPCAWPNQDLAPVMQDLSPRLRAAIEALPSAFSRTLLLVDVAELSYKDAADELGVPVGTVMSRLHRARRLLRTSLEMPQMSVAS
jgi:RNA polymerase sigma-70 factor (ECF subfamily)